MSEPIFHFFNDCLDDNHPLLKDISIHCFDCRKMVHCLNEIMQAWFETGVGPMCLECFTKRYKTEGYTLWTFEELGLK